LHYREKYAAFEGAQFIPGLACTAIKGSPAQGLQYIESQPSEGWLAQLIPDTIIVPALKGAAYVMINNS
jgi:hypothetical protein